MSRLTDLRDSFSLSIRFTSGDHGESRQHIFVIFHNRARPLAPTKIKNTMGNLCCQTNTGKKKIKGQKVLENLIWVKRQDFREVYDIVEQVGKGSISNIYKIRKKSILGSATKSDVKDLKVKSNSVDHVTYALKEILLNQVEEDYLYELENEIALLRLVDHPGVIRAFEVCKGSSNRIALVVEEAT
jgi:serine/threonine protein kinase